MPTCPGCGFEAEPGRDDCPVCGRRLSGVGSGEGFGPPPEGAGPGREGAAPPPEGPTAWEDPSATFPGDLLRTWTESLFRPAALFGRLSLDDSLLRPVLYLILVSVAGAFLDLLSAAMGLRAPAGEALRELYGVDVALEAGQLELLSFFASPFSALLGLLLGTLVVHVFVRLIVSDARRMGATARVLCYASGPGVFGVLGAAGGLPGLLASLVVSAWLFGLVAVGVREVHRTTTGRAVLVVVAPLLFLVLLFLLLGLLVFLAGPEVPGIPVPGA